MLQLDSNQPATVTPSVASSPAQFDLEHDPVRRLTGTTSPRRVTTQPSGNLTLSRTPLVGRDHELAAIQHLLLQEQVGLLTVSRS